MSQYEPLYDSFRPSVSDRYVPTPRFSVAPGVFLPGSEVDIMTGELTPDARRRRVQGIQLESSRVERARDEQRAAYKREMSKGGVRITRRASAWIVILLVIVCGVSLLYQCGRINYFRDEIERVDEVISVCRDRNASLQMQIAEASDASKICYAASQRLNMIPSESVEAIHLVAVDTRPRNAARENASAAAVIETQTTPIPAIASNGY